MRKAILLSLFALSIAYAQPSTTTISDTIYNSVSGTPFGGTVIIQGPNITSPNSIPVLGISRTLTISNGAFTVALVPNTNASPNTSTYTLKFSNGDLKTCTVPVSPTPINLAGANCVDGAQATPVPAIIALSQLASGGAAAGQALCFNTYWGPGNCGGGGPISPAITTQTSAYSVTRNDHTVLCNATGGAVTITLPSAVGSIPPAAGVWPGQMFLLKKTDSSGNTCSFASTGGQTFDGASSPLSISVQNAAYWVQSDGANWRIISKYAP